MTTLFDHVEPRRHATHSMHTNSLDAWRSIDPETRQAAVCRVLDAHRRPMTDREICTALGAADMNYARPAVTHLIQEGVLREVDSVRCSTTGRRVRRVWFVGRAMP
jgi:hypothetical protein